jgi:hypothetical protein
MKFPFSPATALLLISSAFLFDLAGCTKSNSSNSSTGSMSASLGGAAWASNYPITAIYTSASQEFQLESFKVVSGDTTGFAIRFYGPVTLNQALSSTSTNIDIEYANSLGDSLYSSGAFSGHSTLTITSYDSTGHTIGGTFGGVLYAVTGGIDSTVVTNGTFSTPFTAD